MPTPKTEPILYATLASYIVGLLARYGLQVDQEAVLAALGLVTTLLAWVAARRRTAAIHPSSGETVGSKSIASGVKLADPKN